MPSRLLRPYDLGDEQQAVAYLRGREMCDELLEDCFGISVLEKAINPLTPTGFLVMQNQMATAIAGAAKGAEGAALRAAINELDVDWAKLSASGRAEVLRAAKAAAQKAVPITRVSEEIAGKLKVKGRIMGAATKKNVQRTMGVAVSTELSAIDKRILDHIATSRSMFVRDEFGRRSEAMTKTAKSIVDSGLERGLGREALRGELQAGLSAWNASASANYWRTVANSFASTARSYSTLSIYRDAGVTKYTILAVLDRSTTLQCRFMHGTTYDVAHGIQNLETQSSTGVPSPWLYMSGLNQEGKRDLYFKDSQGERNIVGTVERDARGLIDRTGTFSNRASAADLADQGIDTPPFHANCRTTVEAHFTGGGPAQVSPSGGGRGGGGVPFVPPAPTAAATRVLPAAEEAFVPLGPSGPARRGEAPGLRNASGRLRKPPRGSPKPSPKPEPAPRKSPSRGRPKPEPKPEPEPKPKPPAPKPKPPAPGPPAPAPGPPIKEPSPVKRVAGKNQWTAYYPPGPDGKRRAIGVFNTPEQAQAAARAARGLGAAPPPAPPPPGRGRGRGRKPKPGPVGPAGPAKPVYVPPPTKPDVVRPTRTPPQPKPKTPPQTPAEYGNRLKKYADQIREGKLTREAQAEIRAATQDYMRARYGLTTKSNMGQGGTTFEVKRNFYANASHDQRGGHLTFDFKRAQSLGPGWEAATSRRAAAEALAQEGRYAGIRTNFHEDIHGMSRMDWFTKNGNGLGFEEATTEILARKVARELYGFERATGVRATMWAAPEVKMARDGRAVYSGVYGGSELQGVGSYHNFIDPLFVEVAEVLWGTIPEAGFAEAVAQRIESACVRFRQAGAVMQDTNMAIRQWIADLDLPVDKVAEMEMRLLRADGPFSGNWSRTVPGVNHPPLGEGPRWGMEGAGGRKRGRRGTSRPRRPRRRSY